MTSTERDRLIARTTLDLQAIRDCHQDEEDLVSFAVEIVDRILSASERAEASRS